MKSLILLFIWACIIPGCGTMDEPVRTQVDPALQPLVTEWEEQCHLHLRSRDCNTNGIEKIALIDTFDEEETVGQCRVRFTNFRAVRTVYIKSDIPLDTYTAKAVMLHEMLHCRFNIEHSDSGIMAAEILYGELTLESRWYELVEQAYKLVK